MKKKMKTIVSTVTALVMALGFVSCGDDDKVGLKPPTPSIEQKTAQVQSMPETTNENQIENAIDEVFGVDIDLPQGNYSAETFSFGDASAYAVTISGSNTTATEYYNSIKEEMTKKGYMLDESELAFYKIVGTVVYSVDVDSEGGDIVVYTGVASVPQEGTTPGGTTPGGTTPGGTIPGGTIPGGTTPGGTTPGGLQSVVPSAPVVSGGQVGVAAPTTFTLPTNVKVVTSIYGIRQETTIKIGDNYYYTDHEGYEVFYAFNGTDYVYYEKRNGEWRYDGEDSYEDVLEECFSYATTYQVMVSDLNRDIRSTGNSQIIAGVNTKEYVYNGDGFSNNYWISDTGVCFNVDYSIGITTWDTGVTEFGVDVPDLNAKTAEFDFDDLPENVAIRKQSGVYGDTDTLVDMIKIGDRYLITTYNLYYDEPQIQYRYFLKKVGPYKYEYYQMVGGEWTKAGTTTSPSSYDPLNKFKFMFNNDVSKYTKGANETYVNKDCEVYVKVGTYFGTPSRDTIYLAPGGFVLKYVSEMNYSANEPWENYVFEEVVIWNENVTEFGIDVPQ